MLIKDPLQIESSPYEILNIDPSADDAKVKRAMGMAIMAKKFKPNQIQAANLVLTNPQKRAHVNLLMYPVETVHSVTGSGTSKSLPLDLDVREGTAQNWLQQLQDKFPNNTLLHALSVLWYWWAVYETERHLSVIRRLGQNGVSTSRITRKDTLMAKIAESEKCGHSPGPRCPNASCEWYQDCTHSGPGLQEIWEKTLAFNTLITTTPRIWNELYQIEGTLSESVAEAHRDQLEADLTNLRKNLANASASALESQSEQLMLDFTTEQRTASLMKGVRFYRDTETSYSVGCGHLLMRELNQLDIARRSIDTAVRQNTGSTSFLETCRELQRLLSPYANIAGQIARKRWESALEIIDGLASTDKSTADVKCMNAQALIGLGFQELGLNHEDQAIKYWGEAKKIPEGAELWGEAEGKIEQQVLTRAAQLEKVGKKDDAINILNQTWEIGVKGEEIKTRLASVSYSEGVRVIQKVNNKLEKSETPPSTSDVREVRKGVDLIQQAAGLGHPNAASEAVKVAGLLDQLEEGVSVGRINQLREEAARAAKQGNWKLAVSKLEAAKAALPINAPEQLRNTINEELNICQNNLQNELFMGPVIELRKKANAAAAISDWKNASYYLSSALGKIPYGGSEVLRSDIKKDLATCLTNKAIGSLNAELQAVQQNRYHDPYALQSVINEAKSDLERAYELDPNNAHIQEQLISVYGMLGMKASTAGGKLKTKKKSKTRGKSQNGGWVVNIILLLAGALLLYYYSGILVLALFWIVVFLKAKPGRGLAWLGVLLGVAGVAIGVYFK